MSIRFHTNCISRSNDFLFCENTIVLQPQEG
uniref:Uncharacterized protein n=1 Tax=Arundo donax TaxID=35708 RepID=A0A0A9CRU0_ARUDO